MKNDDYPAYYTEDFEVPEAWKSRAKEELREIFDMFDIRPGKPAHDVVLAAKKLGAEIDGGDWTDGRWYKDDHVIRLDWNAGVVDYLYLPFDGETGEFTDESLHGERAMFDYFYDVDTPEFDRSVQYIPLSTIFDVKSIYASTNR